MKKILLSMLLAGLTCGAQATEMGEYLYSPTAKYKVTGANVISNGCFNVGDGFEGWTTTDGNALSGDAWGVMTKQGPQEENVLMALGVPENGNEVYSVANQWGDLAAGFYTLSYWVKAESATTSGTDVNGSNYINFKHISNALGENTETVLAAAESIGTTWKQVVYTFTANPGDAIVFEANNLAAGTMLTGFELEQAQEVYDTRVAERRIAYVETLLNDPDLAVGADEIRGMLEAVVKPSLQDPAQSESKEAMEALMDEFEAEFNNYLDNNGGNIIGIYLYDWQNWTYLNYNGMTTRNNWTFEGGRWGFSANDGNLERPVDDGYVASAGIQTGYQLNVGVRTAEGALDILPPGKYFFSIEAQAVAASNRANPYGANHNVEIRAPWIFVGNDTTVLEDVVLNGYYWQTFYKIVDVKEGDEMKAGFHFPLVDGNTGGRYSLRNPQVRQLGVDKSQLQLNYDRDNIILQQTNLLDRLTNYPIELKDYAWEQDSLQRAISIAQEVYDASLLVIDAEGNVLDASQVNAAYTELVLAEVNRLGRARTWVISSNQPIADLKAAIEAAQASLDNEQNKNASASFRAALEAAVTEGQALIDGITAVNQGTEFQAAIEKIKKAQEEFEATAANRANPTEIVIANGDFSSFSAGNNITSEGTNKDWNWNISASTSRWEIRDNETLPQGHGASIWRGTTVQLDGKAQQITTLPYEGLYEYRAMAYISEERLAELTNSAVCDFVLNADEERIDTIYKPNIRLFFGRTSVPDSITLSKCYLGVKNDGSYFTRDVSGTAYPGQVYASYSIFFSKSGQEPTEVEFGLEALDNFAAAGANGFGFGNNQVFYLGNEAQYLTDTRADLNNLVAEAKQKIAGVESYWVEKANRYIRDAEAATTAKEMQNAYLSLQEIVSRIEGSISAVKGVMTNGKETIKRTAKGVYTLSGVKVADEAGSLQPGLYIINGKKVVIR
ncbi:MAG: hypothetical protein IJ570_01225 [Prevotella sp.]|nr:hypothetical protein [Bacteroidaceae bacterium]MBR1414472.1 hypothetical protein [Prevotella sp.]